jgi:hypothetical protein
MNKLAQFTNKKEIFLLVMIAVVIFVAMLTQTHGFQGNKGFITDMAKSLPQEEFYLLASIGHKYAVHSQDFTYRGEFDQVDLDYFFQGVGIPIILECATHIPSPEDNKNLFQDEEENDKTGEVENDDMVYSYRPKKGTDGGADSSGTAVMEKLCLKKIPLPAVPGGDDIGGGCGTIAIHTSLEILGIEVDGDTLEEELENLAKQIGQDPATGGVPGTKQFSEAHKSNMGGGDSPIHAGLPNFKGSNDDIGRIMLLLMNDYDCEMIWEYENGRSHIEVITGAKQAHNPGETPGYTTFTGQETVDHTGAGGEHVDADWPNDGEKDKPKEAKVICYGMKENWPFGKKK